MLPVFRIGLLIVLTFLLVGNGFSQVKLNVVYPREGMTVTAADSTFIFGSVNPPEARLSINDNEVAVYPNGAFLAFLPIETGEFTFLCQATLGSDTTMVLRNVYIPHYLATSTSDSVVIDTSYVFPREDWELQPDDVLKVAVKGTPGCSATFSIKGLAEDLPMTEIPPRKELYWGEAVFGQGAVSKTPNVKGIYTGVYIIKHWDWAQNVPITFRLVRAGKDTAEFEAPGRFSIDNAHVPVIAQLTHEVTVARTGPRLGYQLFLPQGVKVWVTGKRGEYRRVRLSATEEVWIPEENMEFLPLGTPLPEGIVSVVRTKGFKDRTRVKIFLQERLPYRIEQVVEPPALFVTLYGVTANTDWIRLDFGDPLIREIRWAQIARGVYQLKIELNEPQQWGYTPYYENSNFIIDIKKPPKISGWPSSPLKGIVVCLDPGHGPDLGAVGPTGVTEREANLLLAHVLKRKLEDKGTFVVLTRDREQGASLYVRPQIAAFVGADILLSLHHNALPDGVNPFKNRGVSTYYYHPQSYRLAYIIQEKLLKALDLPNYGLYYDNLALCRPTQMLAVLVEPGFIMHPEEERLIQSPKFREKVAEVLVDALEEFLKECR